jgi:methionyl-tRNA synthetase
VSGQPDFQATNDSVYHQLMQNNEFTKAIDHIWQKIQNLNKRIDFEKPWAVAKTNPAAAQKLLTSLGVDLLQISALLSPFLPATAQKITQIFTIDATVTPTEPLFPKL